MPRIVVGLISIGKRLAVKVKPGGLTGCAELPSHIGIERAIHKEKIIKRIFPSVSRWTFPVSNHTNIGCHMSRPGVQTRSRRSGVQNPPYWPDTHMGRLAS